MNEVEWRIQQRKKWLEGFIKNHEIKWLNWFDYPAKAAVMASKAELEAYIDVPTVDNQGK
jgi:hypothetical protein